MQRIQSADNLFHEGNPAIGEKGTKVTAAFLNHVQEEIANFIEAAGITLENDTDDQLLSALRSMAMLRVPTMAALRLMTGSATLSVIATMGYYAIGDGGQLPFRWDGDSEDSDNGGTVILPTGHTGAGRWISMENGPISVRCFGAHGDGVSDDTMAFQAALNASHAVSIPPGDFCVTHFWKETGGQPAGSANLYFRGAGSDRTTIRLIGDETDVYTYTLGTTTISAPIFFSTGGDYNTCNVGGFRLIGNETVDYGLAIANMFRGSLLSDIRCYDFQKTGDTAVPLTLYRNVGLAVRDFITDMTGRCVRLVGMNDGVLFQRNTHYNFGTTHAAIFVEVGYNSVSDTLRYPVHLIFDESYFHGGDKAPYASMTVSTRTAIEVKNTRDLVLNNIWFERVGYALKAKYINDGSPYNNNNYMVISGCNRGGTDIPQIVLENSCYGDIYWDWPITVDPLSKYNRIIHGQIDDTITDQTTYEENDIFAIDGVRFNGQSRPFEIAKTIFTCGSTVPGSMRTALSNGITDLWTASGTNGEFYYTGSAISTKPYALYANGVKLTAGTLGSLTSGQWAWGDNDSRGNPTVYIKLAVGDPDGQVSGYVKSIDTGKGRIYTRTDGSGQIYSYSIADDTWSCINITPSPTRSGPVFQAAYLNPATATTSQIVNALITAKIMAPS